MRLHMADIHLHRARIFRDRDELAQARALIEACGYWRRREELADADQAGAIAHIADGIVMVLRDEGDVLAAGSGVAEGSTVASGVDVG